MSNPGGPAGYYGAGSGPNPYAQGSGSANPYAQGSGSANPYAQDGQGYYGQQPPQPPYQGYNQPPPMVNPYAYPPPNASQGNPPPEYNPYAANPYANPPPAVPQEYSSPPPEKPKQQQQQPYSSGNGYGGDLGADYVVDMHEGQHSEEVPHPAAGMQADGGGGGGGKAAGGLFATRDPSEYTGGLSDASVRNGFLRKVYSLLTIQLVITGGFCALFSFTPALITFSMDYWWLIYVMLIPVIVLLVALMCNSKKYPLNLILLFSFTICESFLLGLLCGNLADNIGGWAIMGCFITTAGVFVIITIFVFVTKKDFSFLLVFLIAGIFIVGLAFFVWWIVSLATYNVNQWAVFGISIAGALVMCGWILYDTSKIVLHYSPDMYIDAVVALYLDFINLFQCLLCAAGSFGG